MNYISSETPHKKKKDGTLAYVHKENHKVKICSLINDGYEKGFVARHTNFTFCQVLKVPSPKWMTDFNSPHPLNTLKFEITALKLKKWFRIAGAET